MACRILQFCLVFAIGFDSALCLAQLLATASDAGLKTIPFPLRLQDPQDVLVSRGSPATLRCDHQVIPPGPARVSWLHDGRLVDPDDRRVLGEDGSLRISAVTDELAGSYRCRVEVDGGRIVSTPARLDIIALDETFEKEPEDCQVEAGKPAALHCEIHSIPKAQIQWELNELPLPHNLRYVPLPSGTLLVTVTNSSDAGSYRCIATNPLLNITRYSESAQLRVLSSSDNFEKPSFLPLKDVKKDVSAKLGENVKLYCPVTGSPTPTVKWFRGNVVIENGSVLEFPYLYESQTGDYWCVASNFLGSVRAKYEVVLSEKPAFNVTPTSKEYPSGITVRLDCAPTGVPTPKVYWLKNGERIKPIGRVKNQHNGNGIVLSHTFTHDAGFYQCVAENQEGTVWAAAQLLLLSSKKVPPSPINLNCRPYDDNSICLTWKAPAKVRPQAYSVYAYKLERNGNFSNEPEFVTNSTYQLATRLHRGTEYSFYVRLYAQAPSDESNTVVCRTGTIGNRNLTIRVTGKGAVKLNWNKISTDVPCSDTESAPMYAVQWRKLGITRDQSELTKNYFFDIEGLSVRTRYEFRVISTSRDDKNNPPWTSFVVPGIMNGTSGGSDYDDIEPIEPEHLQGNCSSTHDIYLTWDDYNAKVSYFLVCYFEADKQTNCSTSTSTDGGASVTVQSMKNEILIPTLKPNTSYKFQVRSHVSDDLYSPYSEPIEILTPLDVPSPVLDLNYTIVNDSTVCLHWKTPLQSDLKITKYVISYTPDVNRPMTDWSCVTVSVDRPKHDTCWPGPGDENVVSVLFGDLKIEENYTLFVMAVSDVGNGRPVKPIEISTNKAYEVRYNDAESRKQFDYKFIAIGIVLGAVALVVFVALFIFIRRMSSKRLRRRSEGRAGAGGGPAHNYCPAVAHYATQSSSVQVRLEEPADSHETQHLVDESLHQTAHIPPVKPTHLDTKGVDLFPNGHINGSTKPFLNGHLPNGSVHITENPNYYHSSESNGASATSGLKSDRRDPVLKSAAPAKKSKLGELQRLFENSKKSPSYRQCDESSKSKLPVVVSLDVSADSSLNDTLNLTQLTDDMADDSVIERRKPSPILGPNG